jgi:hypothetical protein
VICLKSIVLATLAVVSFQVYAHEGHDHADEGLSDKEVAQLASKTLPSLVQSKKVDAAWSKAQRENVAMKSAAGKNIWVVTYKNPDGKVDGGKPLYLIFDDLGNFVEANHSAKVATE